MGDPSATEVGEESQGNTVAWLLRPVGATGTLTGLVLFAQDYQYAIYPRFPRFLEFAEVLEGNGLGKPR